MNPGPDRDAVSDVYRTKYVVFMDILGFKELVEEADRGPETRGKLLRALTRLKRTATANPHFGLRLSHFSDSLILSVDHSPKGLAQLLLSVDLIVFNLLQLDVFVRGGMAIGGVHHDEDFVYGLAVNAAYELEQTKPGNPWILVSDQVANDMISSGFGHYLERDPDEEVSRPFLHYLLQYATYDPQKPTPGMVVLDDSAAQLMRSLAHRLSTHSGEVLRKAQWFQEYWNRTVAPAGVFGRI
jgi:hypothetical protein